MQILINNLYEMVSRHCIPHHTGIVYLDGPKHTQLSGVYIKCSICILIFMEPANSDVSTLIPVHFTQPDKGNNSWWYSIPQFLMDILHLSSPGNHTASPQQQCKPLHSQVYTQSHRILPLSLIHKHHSL